MDNQRSLITDNYYYPPYSWGTHHKTCEVPREHAGVQNFLQFTGVCGRRGTPSVLLVFTDSSFEINLAPTAFLKLKTFFTLMSQHHPIIVAPHSQADCGPTPSCRAACLSSTWPTCRRCPSPAATQPESLRASWRFGFKAMPVQAQARQYTLRLLPIPFLLHPSKSATYRLIHTIHQPHIDRG